MNRRLFLGAAASAISLAAAGTAGRMAFGSQQLPTVDVRYPGMSAGHAMRDMQNMPAPSEVLTTEVVILGSGAAALACAWQLRKLGKTKFLMLDGTRPNGNLSFGSNSVSSYPHAAHYLPVPPVSCLHVREMLSDFGVLLDGLTAERPTYDERALVHAPAERVLGTDGTWHTGLVPPMEAGSPAARQWNSFLGQVEKYRSARTANGLPAFMMPRELGDVLFRELDRLTFGQWLSNQGITHPDLLWYFDYCCRDEYGADASIVSAWAGVHYFTARGGHAQGAEDGAVLTWPQGLGFMAQNLGKAIGPSQRLGMSALEVRRIKGGAEVLAIDTVKHKVVAIRASRVVVATPLATARRIVREDFEDLRDAAGPLVSPWLVSNFTLSRFPGERQGAALSWDNVVLGSKSLGYVNATHQLIRVARPAGTVFTTYHALGQAEGHGARNALAQMSQNDMLALAGADLDQAYGKDWHNWVVSAELTVHGHAMATPTVGFLDNRVAARARASDDAILYAHSDLAGYSVFEEASWWGVRAARLATK